MYCIEGDFGGADFVYIRSLDWLHSYKHEKYDICINVSCQLWWLNQILPIRDSADFKLFKSCQIGTAYISHYTVSFW